jgi:hypothetical protein
MVKQGKEEIQRISLERPGEAFKPILVVSF